MRGRTMQNIGLSIVENAKDTVALRVVRDAPPLPDPLTARVAVVGLGYVGLPLICGFSNNSRSIGLDIDEDKITELQNGIDRTGEVTHGELANADATFATDAAALAEADAILVCVPTPVNARNRPDYGPLLAASKSIGANLRRGAVVVYESTVDPGTTEEKCIPVLEAASGLRHGVDFYVGYSPERINPADPTRRLADIKKIVAGSTPAITEWLVVLYGRVVTAGLFPAASIKVAEAAKILENTQRDVNIALMNELMALYDKMGIRAFRRDRGSLLEVELPPLPPRHGGRPLHCGGPLLPRRFQAVAMACPWNSSPPDVR